MSEIPVLVTGDDISLPVTLKKNGATFSIDAGATVIGRLVTRDRKNPLTIEVTQSNAAPADWGNSLVMVVFTSTHTKDIEEQGPALLEIQVDDSGKRTWFVSIVIARGNIA